MSDISRLSLSSIAARTAAAAPAAPAAPQQQAVPNGASPSLSAVMHDGVAGASSLLPSPFVTLPKSAPAPQPHMEPRPLDPGEQEYPTPKPGHYPGLDG